MRNKIEAHWPRKRPYAFYARLPLRAVSALRGHLTVKNVSATQMIKTSNKPFAFNYISGFDEVTGHVPKGSYKRGLLSKKWAEW